jgi:hypothetical protein
MEQVNGDANKMADIWEKRNSQVNNIENFPAIKKYLDYYDQLNTMYTLQKL